MFSTDFIFRQQENLVDNQKCQAGFRPLCNKILLWSLNPGDRICRGAGMNSYHASLLEDIYSNNEIRVHSKQNHNDVNIRGQLGCQVPAPLSGEIL